MRLPVSYSFALTAFAVLHCCARPAPGSGPEHCIPTAGNGTYIAVDPLANVRLTTATTPSLGMAV